MVFASIEKFPRAMGSGILLVPTTPMQSLSPNFFEKNFSQFFARFSLSKLSVKFCSPYDEISFYMKEAEHSSYRTHQKLFSYHMYNWFKFEPKQNLMYFFMISSILSFNQPRLKINSLTFCNKIFVFSKLKFISFSCFQN